MQSPAKFGRGLAQGSLSLVKGTVGGVFNTVGSITGSVSKGLAIASMDEKFMTSTGQKQQKVRGSVSRGALFVGAASIVR